MPKNQKSRKGRRPFKRQSTTSSRSDPSFTHTLSYTYFNSTTAPTAGTVLAIRYSGLAGFAQLSTFFEMAQPMSYRIRVSYTGWSGIVAFVPVNPLDSFVPIFSNLDVGALDEVRGAVRIQSGSSNTGGWSRFPFATGGFQTYGLFNNNLNLGYIATYNDAPTVVSWTTQLTIEVKVKFFRRTLYFFAITPTLRSEQELPLEEEEKEISYDKIDLSDACRKLSAALALKKFEY